MKEPSRGFSCDEEIQAFSSVFCFLSKQPSRCFSCNTIMQKLSSIFCLLDFTNFISLPNPFNRIKKLCKMTCNGLDSSVFHFF